MCAELNKFWFLAFLGVKRTHSVKNFPNDVLFIRPKSHMQKTFNLPGSFLCCHLMSSIYEIEKVVNDKETNWHGVIMFT